MIKAIIFDCFGVMLANAYVAHVARLREENPEALERVHEISRAADKGLISVDEAREQIAEEFGVTSEALKQLEAHGEQRNVELLAYAKSLRATYKVAMLSNIGSRERLDVRFLPGELDDVFELVIASGDVGYIKPEPEIYELTATRLGVLPEECIMIDDNLEFCEGANRAGMTSLQFISNTQVMQTIPLLIDSHQETA